MTLSVCQAEKTAELALCVGASSNREIEVVNEFSASVTPQRSSIEQFSCLLHVGQGVDDGSRSVSQKLKRGSCLPQLLWDFDGCGVFRHVMGVWLRNLFAHVAQTLAELAHIAQDHDREAPRSPCIGFGSVGQRLSALPPSNANCHHDRSDAAYCLHPGGLTVGIHRAPADPFAVHESPLSSWRPA